MRISNHFGQKKLCMKTQHNSKIIGNVVNFSCMIIGSKISKYPQIIYYSSLSFSLCVYLFLPLFLSACFFVCFLIYLSVYLYVCLFCLFIKASFIVYVDTFLQPGLVRNKKKKICSKKKKRGPSPSYNLLFLYQGHKTWRDLDFLVNRALGQNIWLIETLFF